VGGDDAYTEPNESGTQTDGAAACGILRQERFRPDAPRGPSRGADSSVDGGAARRVKDMALKATVCRESFRIRDFDALLALDRIAPASNRAFCRRASREPHPRRVAGRSSAKA